MAVQTERSSNRPCSLIAATTFCSPRDQPAAWRATAPNEAHTKPTGVLVLAHCSMRHTCAHIAWAHVCVCVCARACVCMCMFGWREGRPGGGRREGGILKQTMNGLTAKSIAPSLITPVFSSSSTNFSPRLISASRACTALAIAPVVHSLRTTVALACTVALTCSRDEYARYSTTDGRRFTPQCRGLAWASRPAQHSANKAPSEMVHHCRPLHCTVGWLRSLAALTCRRVVGLLLWLIGLLGLHRHLLRGVLHSRAAAGGRRTPVSPHAHARPNVRACARSNG